MRYEKSITTRIDIRNPVKAFGSDPQFILNYLRANFEKKCFRECFILEILDILNQDRIYPDLDRNNSYCSVSVMFRANVIEYPSGAVLPCCEITHKNKLTGTLHCKTDHVFCFASVDPTESFKVGQFINLMIESSRYNIGAEVITVDARQYTPPVAIESFFMDASTFTADQQETIDMLKSWLSDEIAAAGKIKKTKEYSLIERVYRTYKTSPEPPKQTIDVLAAEKTKGFLAIDPKLSLADCKLVSVDTAIDSTGIPLATGFESRKTSGDNYISALFRFINHMRMLRESYEIHAKDPESFKSSFKVLHKKQL